MNKRHYTGKLSKAFYLATRSYSDKIVGLLTRPDYSKPLREPVIGGIDCELCRKQIKGRMKLKQRLIEDKINKGTKILCKECRQ